GGDGRLPAARDRVGAMQAPHPARRAGRPGGRERALRERDADRRAADRGAGAAGRAHLDRDQGADVTELDFDETLEQQGEIEIPSTLPVLPLKETVIFPQSVSPLAIGQERSVKLVDDVLEGERMLALVTVKDTEADDHGWVDPEDGGTAAVGQKMIRAPEGTRGAWVGGAGRIGVRERVRKEPYLVGEFEEVPDELEESPELEAITRSVQTEFGRL